VSVIEGSLLFIAFAAAAILATARTWRHAEWRPMRGVWRILLAVVVAVAVAAVVAVSLFAERFRG
jgi:anti-sigma-K factor RskA